MKVDPATRYFAISSTLQVADSRLVQQFGLVEYQFIEWVIRSYVLR